MSMRASLPSVTFFKRLLGGIAVIAAMTGAPSMAQDAQTLADIRQEAAVLSVELQTLKRELSTTGSPLGTQIGGSSLERIDLMELQLNAMTARLEELEFRVGRVVKDGTNQLDDINFRLCELEEGCDIANLPTLTPIGGETGGATDVVSNPIGSGDGPNFGEELAVAEEQDFAAALALYDNGEFQAASDAFQSFAQTYTGGFLTGEAHFMRGEALTELGQTSEAGRAYLASFSGSPDGDRAPDALLGLGTSLATLGKLDQGCAMFGELDRRFAASPAASAAREAAASFGCAE